MTDIPTTITITAVQTIRKFELYLKIPNVGVNCEWEMLAVVSTATSKFMVKLKVSYQSNLYGTS